MSVYISLCENCHEAQSRTRIMTAVGREHYGSCQGRCMGAQGRVQQYELGPTWAEVERMRRRKKREEARAGGGERARAGTRSDR